ncbi:unnamed protein product [Phytomonas sp. Hart1]|nr:unnamed protein product [Phytomonas sp. Hart1]|eukprot:CCW66676.1 unnamed protein product [Phytomonas sp. isolate Hart1]
MRLVQPPGVAQPGGLQEYKRVLPVGVAAAGANLQAPTHPVVDAFVVPEVEGGVGVVLEGSAPIRVRKDGEIARFGVQSRQIGIRRVVVSRVEQGRIGRLPVHIKFDLHHRALSRRFVGHIRVGFGGFDEMLVEHRKGRSVLPVSLPNTRQQHNTLIAQIRRLAFLEPHLLLSSPFVVAFAELINR